MEKVEYSGTHQEISVCAWERYTEGTTSLAMANMMPLTPAQTPVRVWAKMSVFIYAVINGNVSRLIDEDQLNEDGSFFYRGHTATHLVRSHRDNGRDAEEQPCSEDAASRRSHFSLVAVEQSKLLCLTHICGHKHH